MAEISQSEKDFLENVLKHIDQKIENAEKNNEVLLKKMKERHYI